MKRHGVVFLRYAAGISMALAVVYGVTYAASGSYQTQLVLASFKVNGIERGNWSTLPSWSDSLVDNDLWPHGQYAKSVQSATYQHTGYPPTCELEWKCSSNGSWNGHNPDVEASMHAVLAAAIAKVRGVLEQPY